MDMHLWPLVIYRDREVLVSNPTDFPDTFENVKEVQEPVVKASIIAPEGTQRPCIPSCTPPTQLHTEYFGDMMDLCYSHRAEDVDHRYLDTSSSTASARVILTCIIPLSEIVTDFFDQLKGRSSGFASFEYVVELMSPLLN